MKRYLEGAVAADLEEKMVFLGGPRQVGKTTLALGLLENGSEKHPAYLNWDARAARRTLLQGALPSDEPLVILDEIHKYKAWRNLVKGFYDLNKSSTRFLITGSAKLDHYRRGGDSLQGRYHYHRLHPLSLHEISGKPTRSDLEHLLRFGGFPEPFLKGSLRHWKRWQRERQSRVIQDDLVNLEHVKEVSQLDLLAQVLPDRVGAPLSINNLRGDLSVAFETADRWVTILESLYFCFRIQPYGLPKLRAAKKERKLYMWDWSLCEDPSARFENLVASNLLKYCHRAEDQEGDRMELRFVRDAQRRELDFVVVRNRKPMFAVECKTGAQELSRNIAYFAERTGIPRFYQVHAGERDYEVAGVRARVLPVTLFAGVLGV
ncbi:MAG: ATP-binding protein [Kiritimatiellae bacterium]|nr:ATP-binding protein [Kiritimatiellia bacterium]